MRFQYAIRDSVLGSIASRKGYAHSNHSVVSSINPFTVLVKFYLNEPSFTIRMKLYFITAVKASRTSSTIFLVA